MIPRITWREKKKVGHSGIVTRKPGPDAVRNWPPLPWSVVFWAFDEKKPDKTHRLFRRIGRIYRKAGTEGTKWGGGQCTVSICEFGYIFMHPRGWGNWGNSGTYQQFT